MKKREKLADFAVLGGTFDPIHIAHLIIAQRVVEHLELKRCIFIPSAQPPHKRIVVAEARHRLRMTELACRDNPAFSVSDMELSRAPQPSYTYHTIQELRQIHNCQMPIPFIIGADTLSEIPTWFNYRNLLENIMLIVAPRFGYPDCGVQPAVEERAIYLSIPRMELSSTTIREMLAKKESIRYLVPHLVEEYIYQNGLYHTT